MAGTELLVRASALRNKPETIFTIINKIIFLEQYPNETT
jgi:hypothetical protein